MLISMVLLPLIVYGQTNFRVIGEPLKLAGGDGNYYIQPLCSPDGSIIAFTESNYKGLWLMKSAGSEVTQISDEIGAGYDFSWSLDSRQILTRVYKYEGEKRINAIKSFNIENGEQTNISGYSVDKLGSPKWTADNNQIYYLNNHKMEMVTTDMSVKSGLESTIIYEQNSIIFTADQTKMKKSILEGRNNEVYLYVRVSPDGRKITYKVMGGNLFSMNSDGTLITDLGEGYNARWSPDSQYLVYMINTDDGHRFLTSDLYVISADGQEKFQITNTDDRIEMNPTWSADGKQIVYNTYSDGAIYVLNVAD
jgi:Tol biopolymer transport system component